MSKETSFIFSLYFLGKAKICLTTDNNSFSNKLKTSDEYYNCLKYLVENQEDLNEVEKIAIKKEY